MCNLIHLYCYSYDVQLYIHIQLQERRQLQLQLLIQPTIPLCTALALTPLICVALKSYLASEGTTAGSQYEAKRNYNKRGQTEGG